MIVFLILIILELLELFQRGVGLIIIQGALEHERLTEIAYRNLRVKNHREKAEEVGLKGFINDIIQGIEEVKLKYNLPEGLALFEDLQAFVDAYKLRDDGSGGE